MGLFIKEWLNDGVFMKEWLNDVIVHKRAVE